MGYEGKRLIQFNYKVSDMGSWVNVEVFSLTGKARRGTGWVAEKIHENKFRGLI